MRIIILGNAGSGKSTMARQLCSKDSIPYLTLDDIAWEVAAARKLLRDSLVALERFITNHDQWVIEGCYGDLVEAALPYCTELRFLNPGVDVCIQHCRQRPWESSKFSSFEEQQHYLEPLIKWVQEYETRNDEFGLKRHREIFNQFNGSKREYIKAVSYGNEPSNV